MKRILFLILPCALAPLLAQPAIDLSAAGEPASAKGMWKWHEGDDPRWASPDFDDRAWPEVAVPGSALPKQSGAIWLRIHVKAIPLASITLGTAPLAEASELYWNGQLLGGLGRFPPNQTPEYDIFPRSLIVDA